MADAYIYDAVRTPRGKGKPDGALHEITPTDMSTQVFDALVERNNLATDQVEDVVMGCVSPVGEQGANVGRTAVLSSKLGEGVPSYQLNRFCASGLQAVNNAAEKVASGAA
ncbi:MAG: acetyl-CoA C-acyltransferase, partial [Pseudomonadota bacterium]